MRAREGTASLRLLGLPVVRMLREEITFSPLSYWSCSLDLCSFSPGQLSRYAVGSDIGDYYASESLGATNPART